MTCRHEGYNQFSYCGLCGASLTPTQCSCGHMINPDENFCTQCGANAVNASTSQIEEDQRYNLTEMIRLNKACEQLPGIEKRQVSQDDIDELFKGSGG